MCDSRICTTMPSTAPMPRYFRCKDGGAIYFVVARDRDHAEQILRDADGDFELGFPQKPNPPWVELDRMEASQINIRLGEGDSFTMPDGTRSTISFENGQGGTIPLASLGVGECASIGIGNWFTTEV